MRPIASSVGEGSSAASVLHDSPMVEGSRSDGDPFVVGLNDAIRLPPSRRTWKGVAILRDPEALFQRVVPSAEEEAKFAGEQKKLQSQLDEMSRAFAQIARHRWKLLCKRYRCRGVRAVPLEGVEKQFQHLFGRRNRLLRRIRLRVKRHRQYLVAVPQKQCLPVVEFFHIGPPSCKCIHCGAIMWLLESTTASRSADTPSFALCCKHGKVKLPRRREPPNFLKFLLEDDSPLARHFRLYIRAYNGIFCLISIGGKVNHSINDGRGVYVYSLGGQIYHRMGSLVPAEGSAPRYAQLYIHDPDNELRNRLDCYSSDRESNPLRVQIVQGLQSMLDSSNVLVRTFRSARDRIRTTDLPQVQLRLFAKRDINSREYDLPTVNEIAAFVVDETGEQTFAPDIVIERRNSEMERVSPYHPSVMALQYPLLFPYGEDGWHPAIPYSDESVGIDSSDKMVTQCEYYSYRLQTRLCESNSLMQAGKLFQQYVVNAFALVEAERFDWMRNNQTKLRGHHYQGVCESFLRGDNNLKMSGKHVILAASHTGSPRYKYENFQDAMAICKWIGYPDLFITFTCNSNWPEIQMMVDLCRQSSGKDPNRADIIARVFKIKIDEFMIEIRDKQIFGKILGYVRAIEWQKRGLPHAHTLIFLAPESKFHTPADIDSIISAELPEPDIDPECYSAVTSSMMHGPCGLLAPKNSCMQDGRCTKHYPKEFCDQTTVDESGFVRYRCRNNGQSFQKGGVSLDNRCVVPYNRYLLLRFGAHINVEICNKTRAVKYLCKYINKPEDRAMAALSAQSDNALDNAGSASSSAVSIDEIKAFMDGRYITAGESCWRLFRFDIYKQSPSVLRMSFHLPGENTVYANADSRPESVMRSKRAMKSMLLSWMKCNETWQEARNYTFVEFPQHFVWNDTDKTWQKRKRGQQYGRLYYCYPSVKERYYLRVLLHIVKGCTSYKDIRSVNGVVYDTFQEACHARGLLAEDSEWNNCIQEVAFWGTGYKLRRLFVIILLHCQVSDVHTLWENNWRVLSDDILKTRRRQLKMPFLTLSDNAIQELCLLQIDQLLQRQSKSLADFPGLPIPNQAPPVGQSNRTVAEEFSYISLGAESDVSALRQQLNIEQKNAFDNILRSIYEDAGKCFFVDGFGGTGKTFLWRTLWLHLRAEQKIVLCVASSGIAALLMVGGRTAHSRFQIPIDCHCNSTCNIEHRTELAELLQSTSLIIWDEAPMSHKYSIEALDKTLRDILSVKYADSKNKVFGGMTVVFGGDFRQTLPIIVKGSRTDIVNSSIKRSYLWRSMNVLQLTINMRLMQPGSSVAERAEIATFSDWLLAIGAGSHSNIFGESVLEIPLENSVQRSFDPVADIVTAIYSDLVVNHSNGEYLVERAILAPHHDSVSTINKFVLAMSPGEETSYLSSDWLESDGDNQQSLEEDYSVEFLNTLKVSNFPEHELTLKVGCPVMLLRNMDQNMGLCNGIRMLVTRLGQWFLEVQILTGTHIGETIYLPQLTLSTHVKSLNFTLVRRQYPIAVSYAMTINKSQGQTLRHVGLFLEKQVFSHGQLYVALSRVTSKRGLKILSCDPEGRELTTMQNVVFTEIFD